MRLKKVTQQVVATEFGIKQPSVSEWIRFGRIGKEHISHLVDYFSDVVDASHWGLQASTHRDALPDAVLYDAQGDATILQVKEFAASYKARPGELAADMAKSLSTLSESRRKTIAMLVSAQIMDGANAEEVAAIDALAGDAVVTTNYDAQLGQLFREQAHRIAESHPDPATREVLTKFVLEVERQIAG